MHNFFSVRYTLVSPRDNLSQFNQKDNFKLQESSKSFLTPSPFFWNLYPHLVKVVRKLGEILAGARAKLASSAFNSQKLR